MGTERDQVKLLAMGLGDGERSDHLLCPMCSGGSSHERSMLIWVSNGCITYKCYRVKCGFHGRLGDTGVRVKVEHKAKQSFDSLVVTTPPPIVYEYLEERFGLTRTELVTCGIKWEAEQERILIPINGLPTCGEQMLEGYLARAYPALQTHNSATPKAVAHFKVDSPTCLMHPYRHTGDRLVLLEDYWSAMRVARHTQACALSGTSLGDRAISAMLSAGVKRIVFVLDADARQKARKLVAANRLLFQSVRAVFLFGKDPKDMSEDELLSTVIEEINHG